MAAPRDDADADGAGVPAQPAPSAAAGRPAARLSRRWLVAGAAGALSVAAAGPVGFGRASRQDEATPDASPPPGFQPPTFSDDEVEAVIAELAEAGVAVYERADAPEPILPVTAPGPLALLRAQIRAMVLEAASGAGVLGAELDALVIESGEETTAPETGRHAAVAEGEDEPASTILDPTRLLPDLQTIVTPSLLLTAYLTATDSPGARLARRFLPAPAVEEAAEAVYPSLALTLFAAELARDNLDAAGIVPAPLANAARRPVTVLPPAQGGICSAVQAFIDNTLNALFNALHVKLGNSLPGRILGGIVNWLLGSAREAVRTAIRQLLAPVLDVIKSIAGVVGTASVVVSAIRPWSLRMRPNPTATRLAVGGEPPIPGNVACLVDLGGLDEWPADVEDCAAQSGVPLPPLKPAGAACTWLIEQTRPLPLVVTTNRPATLDQNGAATLDYVTTVEDEETARGTPVTGLVRVTLTIARPEIADLQRTIANLLFAQLPAIVAQFVRPILGPTVDGLLGRLAALTDSRSSVTIPVLFHERKPEAPTPEPEPEPEDEAPATIGVEIASIQATIINIQIQVEGGTCDGVDWEGTLRFVAQVPDPGLATIDLDQTLPMDWSFADGDVATATVGPFEAEMVFPLSQVRERYVATFDVTIEQGRDADGRPATLTFTLHATVTFAGGTESGPVAGGPNHGVPIPIVSGNADC